MCQGIRLLLIAISSHVETLKIRRFETPMQCYRARFQFALQPLAKVTLYSLKSRGAFGRSWGSLQEAACPRAVMNVPELDDIY
jgi:hypothetical protein